MNILMVLSQLEVTGAEVYAVSLSKYLISKGHKLYIISDSITKATEAEYQSLSVSDRGIFHRISNSLYLIGFIRRNHIQIVHTHSRAAAWVANIACKICRIPLVTTIHGHQATFLSRKIVKAFGNYTIAVCEEVRDQLFRDFHLDDSKVEVLRNGFDMGRPITKVKTNNPKIISYITRLTGPKGELAYDLLDYFEKNRTAWEGCKIRIIGDQHGDRKFDRFKDSFEFTGYKDEISEWIAESDAVIGSGRTAVESLLHKRPTIAVGEAETIGLVTAENICRALEGNFGDIATYQKKFDFGRIGRDLSKAVAIKNSSEEVLGRITAEFDIKAIGDRIESIYRSVYVNYKKLEIPVLMYHRVVSDTKEAGKHGIYVTAEQFEKHLKYLKNHEYSCLSFDEAFGTNLPDGKSVILSFDDGYRDNYDVAFPILKKYGFKATIFLVAGLNYNRWDCNTPGEPKLEFLTDPEIKKMQKYGIEFGAHTLTHPDLSKITIDQARREIIESKKVIENRTGRRVTIFAYPYGGLNSSVKEIVRSAGFKYGLATDSGPLPIHEDRFQIRRIGVFPNTNFFGFAHKAGGSYTFYRQKKHR